MPITLFNTLSRQKEIFNPIETNQVKIYSCGPTVYNYAHVGNWRAFLFADTLKRILLYNGLTVRHIMNITDVGHLTGDRDMGEDKMQVAVHRERKSAWDIASFYTDAFLHDLKQLNILLPDKLPKATGHIREMIAIIQELEKKGFTYQTSDGIYFDTSKLTDYGKLAKLDAAGLREGARVEVNAEKKNPTDFALWKFSPVDQKRDMEWESPWGVGFPGWHIECSAMSVKYLGQPFDIHTGGIDHIAIHHTNEIAQSEAATGIPLANYWLHSEHVLINEARMGKSEGNLITVDEIVKKGYSPLAYRYFVLQGHYRTRLNFSWEAIDGAQNALDNLYAAIAEYTVEGQIGCAEYEERFVAAVNDDLDTPQALATVWDLLHSDNPPEAKLKSLFQFDAVLGLSLKSTWEELQRPVPEEVEQLVKEREQMRAAKKWPESDKLRDQIRELGFEIKDTGNGPLIKRV